MDVNLYLNVDFTGPQHDFTASPVILDTIARGSHALQANIRVCVTIIVLYVTLHIVPKDAPALPSLFALPLVVPCALS